MCPAYCQNRSTREDTTSDSETNHTAEVVSYLAVQGNGTLTARAYGVETKYRCFTLSRPGQTPVCGTLIAMTVGAAGEPGTTTYLHGDHLGSVSLATDANGVEVPGSRRGFYPFGELRYGNLTNPTDRAFTGQRAQPGLGLYDYRARFYDPTLARFISPDTIVPDPKNSQDLNRYSYVRNSPLRFVDPSGHCSGDPNDPNNPDSACWTLLRGLESDWGIDIQSEDTWDLAYLQYLQDVFNEMGSLIGGNDYLRQILGESAQRGGVERFRINDNPNSGRGWCYYGRIELPLEAIANLDFVSFHRYGQFYESSEGLMKLQLGHELAHIVFGIVPDVEFAYGFIRRWRPVEARGQIEGLRSVYPNWRPNDGGPYMMAFHYSENLAELVGIRVAGQGWGEVETMAMVIDLSDVVFVSLLSQSVPEALR